MSPLEQYNSIIYFRQQYPIAKGERHHIIPKSLGGCNKRWNLVRLTPEEHIECHRLLTEIYPTGKEHKAMATAYALMCTSRDGVKVSPEEAAEARQMMAESKKGQPSPKKGKPATRPPWNKGTKGLQHHTEEWKRQNSLRHRGRKRSDETKRKISEALTGKPKSEEHKRHLRENHADVSKRKDPTTGRFAKRE